MYFLVIMAFAFVLSDNLPPAGFNLMAGRLNWEGMTLSMAFGQIAVVAAAAWIVRRKSLRRLDGTPQGYDRATQLFSTGQFVLLLLIAALLTVTMTLTPWASLVRRQWGLDKLPLIGDLTLLIPFFASLAVIWTIQFPVEARLRGIFPGRDTPPTDGENRKTDAATALLAASNERPPPDAALLTFLWDKFRHQVLIVAAPMALIVGAKHFTDLWRRDLMNATTLPWAADAVLGIVSFLVLLISPVILCYIWATEPLPPGPLRERFERICKRIGLRYRDVLLWHTHGMTVNAAVMGFIPPLRYILVSDALLETMDDEEIEAVFGHEAGHVHHWHLPFFGLFALASMYVTGGVLELLVRGRFITDSGILQLIGLAVLLALWLFGFGWLSRRFERQADLFGVRSVTSDIRKCISWCPVHGDQRAAGVCVTAANLFGRTLSKIAGLNGIPRTAPSWRHGSIESRCRLIERFAQDAAAVNRFDRELLLLKAGLIGAGCIGTIAAGMVYYAEIARALRRLFIGV